MSYLAILELDEYFPEFECPTQEVVSKMEEEIIKDINANY